MINRTAIFNDKWKSALALFLLFLLCACSGKRGEMRIHGEITGLQEADLFVLSPDGGNEGIDTIHIHDGQFDWTTPCTQDEATFLVVWPNFTVTTVFGGSGQVAEITGDAHMLDSVTVKESDDNKELKERYLQKQKAAASIPPTLRIGQKMPSYTLKMLSGRTLGSLSLRGRYVLFAFWASWMGNSMEIASHLRDAAQKPTETGQAPSNRTTGDIVCISYSLDVDRQAMNTAPFATGNWETFCDQLAFQSPLVSRLGIRQLPYYILVGKDGRITASSASWEEISSKL